MSMSPDEEIVKLAREETSGWSCSGTAVSGASGAPYRAAS